MQTKLYLHSSGAIYLGYHFTEMSQVAEVERFVGGSVENTKTGTLVVATPTGAKKLELGDYIIHIPASASTPNGRSRYVGDMRSAYQVYKPDEFVKLFKEKV